MTNAAAELRTESTDDLAKEVLSALFERRQIHPLTKLSPVLDLPTAYRVTAAVRRMREARGERVVGRKIGFTNRTIWDEYDVHAPIWGYVYDKTLHRLTDLDGPFAIDHLVEPRIEPEIVFKLATAPQAGMDKQALLSCVEWVAHGFEIVQSLFPAWRFQAADTVAAFGLHGALILGEPQPVTSGDRDGWTSKLSEFDVTLMRNGIEVDHGRAENVLGGGPLVALRHLVEVLAADPDSPPLAAGEIVTTGTVTKALPISPGEEWSTRLNGLPLPGGSIAFV